MVPPTCCVPLSRGSQIPVFRLKFAEMDLTNIKEQYHQLGPWLIKTTESHILNASGDERELFESKLDLPCTPEMLFSKNSLSLSLRQDEKEAKIEFLALDALKLVDKSKVHVQVPAAKQWSRPHFHKYSILNPFDWTFSTTYSGTTTGDWLVQSTLEGLDQKFIRSRDPILLFGSINLFEDELGDNGISLLNVKIRVMPTGFFVLQRFFLRVDGCLLRIWDTRLQWRLGDKYVLREVKRLDSEMWLPTMVGVQADDAEQLCKQVVEHRTEKLFPELL
uniref:TIP41-like protein n=1 Tax=Echinococcus canadensis TaxID=519352 RepID=A0A915EY11_9CEST